MRALIGWSRRSRRRETAAPCPSRPISPSSVSPARHSAFGLRLMMVSNISVGAGSVAVAARPALPYTDATSGKLDDAVLHLQQLGGLGDRNSGQRRRHVEQRALVQVGHELGAELPRRPYRHGRESPSATRITGLGAQHRLDDRPVDPDQEAVDRILVLRNDPAAHEHDHQRRHQRDGQHRRRRHRKGLGEGERAEQPPLLRFQREDRQERHGDDQQAEEQRRADLGGASIRIVDARTCRARRARDACGRSRSSRSPHRPSRRSRSRCRRGS